MRSGFQRFIELASFFLTFTPIFDEFKNTEAKYKTRIRSRYSNLKDSRNPELRARVLTGDIPPDRIASMTSDVSSELLKSSIY